MFHSSVDRWRHEVRKFAVENFPKDKDQPQSLCQEIHIVTIEVVFNSTHGVQQHLVYGRDCCTRCFINKKLS